MNYKERVAIRRCAPPVDDHGVLLATLDLLRDLGDLSPFFRDKRKILVKTNAGIPAYTITEGRQTELTDPFVLEGVIRAIREVSDAEIVVGDAPTTLDNPYGVFDGLGLPERLKPYANVRIVDFAQGGTRTAKMPDTARMFKEYELHPDIVEADAAVSVAKMKAHRATGFTLCMKNLFGLIPPQVYGYPRHYFHDRNIRLPRVIADLAILLKPCLNVVDGIVAANHGEWGGTPVVPGVLIAGTNIVATDATAARVMGFDPTSDYPHHPFIYRSNSIKHATEAGLGPNRAEDIEVVGPQPDEFDVPFSISRYGGTQADRDRELQEGARCVRWYRENREKLLSQYEGRIVALRDGEVLWDGATAAEYREKEHESGRDYRKAAQLAIRVMPEEEEIEILSAYEPYEDFLPEDALEEAA